MDELRDYVRWHDDYDDPGSSLSWRLAGIRDAIGRFLDANDGPVRVLSACAGDGRDILGVLTERDDAARCSVVLLEIESVLAQRAARTADEQLPNVTVEVRQLDAGRTDSYVGAAPADLVLLVGILGNLTEHDVEATIAAAPQLCAPGATLIWSRSIEPIDRNGAVREWFKDADFAEVDYQAIDWGGSPAFGVERYDGPPVPLQPGQTIFTFIR